MNSVRASSRRPRRVSRPRPVEPERNNQERGKVDPYLNQHPLHIACTRRPCQRFGPGVTLLPYLFCIKPQTIAALRGRRLSGNTAACVCTQRTGRALSGWLFSLLQLLIFSTIALPAFSACFTFKRQSPTFPRYHLSSNMSVKCAEGETPAT